MRTWIPKKGEIARKWWVVDAKGQTLGRMATQIASVLRGKNKPTFSPHVDTGDFVIVINGDKVELSGNKWDEKLYYRHSRFFGGIKTLTAKEQIKKDPAFLVEEAVRGMLPKNKLARLLIKKLKVYAGAEHPHAIQKPEALVINT